MELEYIWICAFWPHVRSRSDTGRFATSNPAILRYHSHILSLFLGYAMTFKLDKIQFGVTS